MLVPTCVTRDTSIPLTTPFLISRRTLLEARVRGVGCRGLAPGSEVLVTREARPSLASAGRRGPNVPLRSSVPPNESLSGRSSCWPPSPSGSEGAGSASRLPHTRASGHLDY